MPTSVEAAYSGRKFSPYGSEVHSESEEQWMVQNTFRIPRDQGRNQPSDFQYDENGSCGDWSREDGDDEWNEPDENGMMNINSHYNGNSDNVQANGNEFEVVGCSSLSNNRQHATNEEPGWLESFFNAMWGPVSPNTTKENNRGGGQTKRSNDTTSASLTSYEVSLDERSNDNSEKEERRRSICCCFSCCRCCSCRCFSPCMKRCCSAFILLAALALIGVFSGRAIRNRAPSSAADGNNDNLMNNVPSSPKADYPTSTPTAAPVTTLHPNYQATDSYPAYSSNVTVGVYYYPWHGDNFHNGGGYIRNQLVPQQMPALGEYDDSDPSTISQHLAWSRQANVSEQLPEYLTPVISSRRLQFCHIAR